MIDFLLLVVVYKEKQEEEVESVINHRAGLTQ